MVLWDIILNFLMGERSLLPPGIRFHPTDVELVLYYLKKKVMGKRLRFEAIPEVDIYKFPPWVLREKSILGNGDLKWYFFCPLEKKYSRGARMNRTAEGGFWKVTGNDRPVLNNEDSVGSIKTLIFHEGKAPGARTDWVMHEYRLEDKNLAEREVVQNDKYVLCVIFQKEGRGPRNGAQYGAPFKEEDWNDDEEVGSVESGPSAGLSTPTYMLPSNYNSSVATGTLQWGDTVTVSCLSETMPSHREGLPSVRANNVVLKELGDGDILSTVLGNNVVSEEPHQVLGDDDIHSMMDHFIEDNTLVSNEDDKYKNPGLDGNDIFDGLGDLPYSDHYLDMTDLDEPLNNSDVLPQ